MACKVRLKPFSNANALAAHVQADVAVIPAQESMHAFRVVGETQRTQCNIVRYDHNRADR